MDNNDDNDNDNIDGKDTDNITKESNVVPIFGGKSPFTEEEVSSFVMELRDFQERKRSSLKVLLSAENHEPTTVICIGYRSTDGNIFLTNNCRDTEQIIAIMEQVKHKILEGGL